MTERQLRTLEENCLNDANRLYCSLQQLAIAASEVLGYEVVADICECLYGDKQLAYTFFLGMKYGSSGELPKDLLDDNEFVNGGKV